MICSLHEYQEQVYKFSVHPWCVDCLVAFAVAAEQAPIPYVKPQVVARTGETAQEEQELVLEQARHPCLETMENISFIPNDANFGKDRRFCIITGPNLGGKSTYLRSVGHWLNFFISFLSKNTNL